VFSLGKIQKKKYEDRNLKSRVNGKTESVVKRGGRLAKEALRGKEFSNPRPQDEEEKGEGGDFKPQGL